MQTQGIPFNENKKKHLEITKLMQSTFIKSLNPIQCKSVKKILKYALTQVFCFAVNISTVQQQDKSHKLHFMNFQIMQTKYLS